MDQTRALNALAPFLALAKSASSPRAAADLVTQATSAPNTYVFAELLQQPNIQGLKSNPQYGGHFELLRVFAWGTWEGYKGTEGLPRLSPQQAEKLRLLSLLTIASTKPADATASTLSYASLSSRLDLASSVELEQLITQAIYSGLVSATLNPAHQTVVIASVAPLRDLAPGSAATMITELEAWSSRCNAVLGHLEAEIALVKADAAKRAARELKAEKQIKAVMDAAEKAKSDGSGVGQAPARGGPKGRGAGRRLEDEDGDDDAMDLDDGTAPTALGGRKKSGGGGGGGIGGLMGRLGRSSGR